MISVSVGFSPDKNIHRNPVITWVNCWRTWRIQRRGQNIKDQCLKMHVNLACFFYKYLKHITQSYYCYYCLYDCLCLPITRVGLRFGWCGSGSGLAGTPLHTTTNTSINISWLGPELRPTPARPPPPPLTEPGQARAGYDYWLDVVLKSPPPSILRAW